MSDMSRRGFFKVVGQGALAAALAEVLLGGSLVRVAFADGKDADVHVAGLPRTPTQEQVDEQTKRALEACFDLDVVKPGHLVLIKVSSNSPRPYPFTSHPMVLKAVVRLTKARGARVVVVDQCGFEHVLNTGDDKLAEAVKKIWGTTFSGYENGLQVLEKNGLAAAAREAGAEVKSLDDESDYVNVDIGSPHWPERTFMGKKQGPGVRVAKIAFEAMELAKRNPPAGHVITIARPGGHVQAGHTGPLKNWYGWIHPADRLYSHLDIGKVKNGDAHDHFGGHDEGHSFLGLKWGQGNLEVKHLHESVSSVAAWMEENVPIRAHIVGAIDTFCDVGPDWGEVAMKGPNMIAASPRGKVAQLDAFTAALVVSEKAATADAEKERQARENDARDGVRFMDKLQTWMFYRLEHTFHDRHGTHYMEPAIAALRDPSKRATDQGAVWGFRQIDSFLDRTGGTRGVKLDVQGTTLPPDLELLLMPPTTRTLGFEGVMRQKIGGK